MTRPAPLVRQLAVVLYDPAAPSGTQRLSTALGWSPLSTLATALQAEVQAASGGLLQYVVRATRLRADMPPWADQSRPDVAAYAAQYPSYQPTGTPGPDLVLAETGLDRWLQSGLVDEVWAVVPPGLGWAAAYLGGPAAYPAPGPPLQGTYPRRVVLQALEAGRPLAEALRRFALRAESLLDHAFGGRFQDPARLQHDWDAFAAYEALYPGQAGCGTVAFAPNSPQAYVYNDPTPVAARCDQWLVYPQPSERVRLVSAAEWGGDQGRALVVRYVGAGSACTVSVTAQALVTTVTGAPDALTLPWTSYPTLGALAQALRQTGVYEAAVADLGPDAAAARLDVAGPLPCQRAPALLWADGADRELAHHRWWLLHLPGAAGTRAGRLTNWWAYVGDPDQTG